MASPFTKKPFFGVPFGSCVMPLTPSGPSWAVLGSFFGSFGVTLGSLWLPLGWPWAPLAVLWVPLGRLGLPWDPGQHLDEQEGRISAACQQNMASWNLPGGPGGSSRPGGPGEVVSRIAVMSPTSTRAGG